MLNQPEEKLEILSDVLPEVQRFTAKAKAFQDVLSAPNTPEYVKSRSWRALQRATTDLREVLAHITRVVR